MKFLLFLSLVTFTQTAFSKDIFFTYENINFIAVDAVGDEDHREMRFSDCVVTDSEKSSALCQPLVQISQAGLMEFEHCIQESNKISNEVEGLAALASAGFLLLSWIPPVWPMNVVIWAVSGITYGVTEIARPSAEKKEVGSFFSGIDQDHYVNWQVDHDDLVTVINSLSKKGTITCDAGNELGTDLSSQAQEKMILNSSQKTFLARLVE